MLSDPEKRKQYDTLAPPTGGPDFRRPGGGGELQLRLRGHLRPLRRLRRHLRPRSVAPARGPRRRHRGRDHALLRRLAARSRDPDPGRGRGRLPRVRRLGGQPGSSPQVCPECRGRGVTVESQGMFGLSHACPRCHGSGTIIEKPCPRCHGSGRERRTKRYKVKIPAGVKDGTQIRLKGKGEPGYGGGPPGDLYRRHARRGVSSVQAPRQRPRGRGAGHVRRRRARREASTSRRRKARFP